MSTVEAERLVDALERFVRDLIDDASSTADKNDSRYGSSYVATRERLIDVLSDELRKEPQ